MGNTKVVDGKSHVIKDLAEPIFVVFIVENVCLVLINIDILTIADIVINIVQVLLIGGLLVESIKVVFMTYIY